MSSDSSRNDPSESFSMADTLSQQSDQSPMVSNLTIHWRFSSPEPEAPNLQTKNMLPVQGSDMFQEVVKDEYAAVLEC